MHHKHRNDAVDRSVLVFRYFKHCSITFKEDLVDSEGMITMNMSDEKQSRMA